MNITKKEIESVVILPASKRYRYFLKKIVDWEECWGLYNDGWALAESKENKRIFPFWPAKEYATICATGAWINYKSIAISTESLMKELLNNLSNESILVGVFYTPKDKGVVVDVNRLRNDIETEQKHYI